MLQKIHAAKALSMVLKRSWTIGLLPTSSTCRPPGWTSKPACIARTGSNAITLNTCQALLA